MAQVSASSKTSSPQGCEIPSSSHRGCALGITDPPATLTLIPNDSEMSERNGEIGDEETVSSKTKSKTADESHSSDLTHNDYTVGWVCALPKEQTAATAMLDQRHPDLSKPPNDHNTYTLGSIGKHNIVIACLPKGQYGANSAATVTTWMVSTFPSIKIGLMVGIGGGVPSKVRLGDVVISTPIDTYPGVVQWDLGKAEDGGNFKRIGALNNPPKQLLTALTKLESKHEMDGSKISQHLDDLGKRWPNLVPKYIWSDSLKDPLVTTEIPRQPRTEWQVQFLIFWKTILTFLGHLLGWYVFTSEDCEAKQATDSTLNVDVNGGQRKPGEIRVHYGLIASGNQVIKDSKFRDSLDKMFDGNVLCVEMEAAGLMNDFPCLVIRGICDYADSQKNKDWQEYAAAIAAAYAKELLQTIDASVFKQMEDARAVVHELKEIKSMTKEIARDQKQSVQEQKQRDLFRWLSPLNPSARHYESQKQRVEGTGVWLLKDPKVLDWLSKLPTCPVLCCYGNPGAGKTIISSLVIDKLREAMVAGSRMGLGYMYYDYRDQKEQTTENTLGAVLEQLLTSLPEIPQAVWQLYQERVNQKLPLSLADAKHLLHITCAEFSRAYICLDAVDELGDQRGLMEFLRDKPSSMQIFLTGRPHIQDTIQKYLNEVLNISIEARESDIRRFIEREIGGPNDVEPDAMDERLRMNILDKVVDSAKGIFLLPVLQVRTVLQALTIREREESLKTLPSNLGEAFAGSMERIQQQPEAQSKRAAHIIAWIHLAKRLLTVDQLLCSLTVKHGDSYFDPRATPVRKTLLNSCHGLVVIDQETSTVRLVHYSLQEYLSRQTLIFKVPSKEWHGRIAHSCLTFLNFPPVITEEGPEQNHIKAAFLGYAATQWGHHLRHYEAFQDAAFGLAKEYLRTGWEKNPESLQLLYEVMYSWYAGKQQNHILPGHIAAFFGVREILSYLSLIGFNVDMKDILGRTPLSWASANGHEAVVRVLLEKGAAVDSTDTNGQTPLSWASKYGNEAVARLLLEKGAAVDSTDTDGQTPLSWASANGHEAVARVLLEKGAAVDSTDTDGQTPLSWASENGHEAVARLLLEKGAAVDSTDTDGQTPLSWASANGYEAVARLLLEKGAAVDSTDTKYGQTPLSWASANGHEAVARLLLKKGATVDLIDTEFGQTPLLWASEMGHEAVARLLLEKGAAVDSTDTKYGRTPLSWASANGYEAVARLLLEKGAAVDSIDIKYGQTPLSWASENGHEAVARLLLEKGAAVDSTDTKYGQTPLSWASEKGHGAVVRVLLEKGAVWHSTDNIDGRMPLSRASRNGFGVSELD